MKENNICYIQFLDLRIEKTHYFCATTMKYLMSAKYLL